jgi:Uma2 family endonuclease
MASSAADPFKAKWTTSDVDRLPDVEGVRYEIIKGELFVSKQPHWHHQATANNIAAELTIWSRESKLGIVIPAPGVLFTEYDNVVPDVAWISHERLLKYEDEAGHLRGAPELVVEALSPGRSNIERDEKYKLELYDAQGVDEYWIADWRLQRIQIYRRADGALKLFGVRMNDELVTSPVLPGFSCPVSRFFG